MKLILIFSILLTNLALANDKIESTKVADLTVEELEKIVRLIVSSLRKEISDPGKRKIGTTRSCTAQDRSSLFVTPLAQLKSSSAGVCLARLGHSCVSFFVRVL